jgi:hypothetical protein
MAGIKIQVSTEEAQVATQKLQSNLEKLGAATKLTTQEMTNLENKMVAKLGADKAQAALTQVATSVGMTKSEIQKFQNQLAPPSFAERVKQTYSSIKDNWMALSIQAAAYGYAVNKALEFREMWAKADQAKTAYTSLADSMHFNGERILADMKRVTNGTVDDSDLMQHAVRAIAQDIDPSQVVKIAEMARMAAQKTGSDVSQMMEQITNSIANQLPRGLKSIGLLSKESFKLVNDAFAQGVSDIDMMRLAMVEYEVQVARMKGVHDNTAESIQAFRAQIKGLKEDLGGGVDTILMGLLGIFQGVASAALGLSGGIFKVIQGVDYLLGLKDRAAYWKSGAEAAFGASEDLALKARTNLSGGKIPNPMTSVGTGGTAGAKTPEQAEQDKKDELEKIRRQLDASRAATFGLAMNKQAYQEDLNFFKKNNELKVQENEIAYQTMLISEEEYQKRKLDLQKEDTQKLIDNLSQQESAVRKSYDTRISLIKPEETGKRQALQDEKLLELAKLKEQKEMAMFDLGKQIRSGKLLELDMDKKSLGYQQEILNSKIGLAKLIGNYTEELDLQTQILEIEKKRASLRPELSSDQRKALNDLYDEQIKRNEELKTPGGAFSQGWRDTINEYKRFGDEMKQLSTDIAKGMQTSFSDFFYDIMIGELKSFDDYIKNFLNSIARAVSNYLGQLMAAGLGSAIQSGVGWIAGAFTGGSTGTNGGLNAPPATGGAINVHTGGIAGETPMSRIVSPIGAYRNHSGIGPNEKVAVVENSEGIFTTGQMKALGLMTKQQAPAQAINLEVVIENKSSQNLAMKKGEFKFDIKKYVQSVIIEDSQSYGPMRQAGIIGG